MIGRGALREPSKEVEGPLLNATDPESKATTNAFSPFDESRLLVIATWEFGWIFSERTIIKSPDAKAIKRVAIERGMKTLRESAMSKVVDGLTSIDEAVQKTQTDDLDLGL